MSGRGASFHLAADGVGLYGDGWSPKREVEAARQSGTDLGDATAERLG